MINRINNQQAPDIVISGDFHYDPEQGVLELLVVTTLQKSALRNLRFHADNKRLFNNTVQTVGMAAHQLLMQGLQTASTNPSIPVSGGNGDHGGISEVLAGESPQEPQPPDVQLDLWQTDDTEGLSAPEGEPPADHNTTAQDPGPTAGNPL